MRLTEKVDNEKFTEAGIRYLTRNQDGIYAVLNKLGEWEDLEEQGRLIELPCKVGDTIWELDEYLSGFDVQPAKVERISFKEIDNKYIYLSFSDRKDGFIQGYGFDDFGTILFLTKEEAEEALKRLQGNE